MKKIHWIWIKLALILVIGILIVNETIHHEEAFVFGTIASFFLINILTGWNPFCAGGCFTKKS